MAGKMQKFCGKEESEGDKAREDMKMPSEFYLGICIGLFVGMLIGVIFVLKLIKAIDKFLDEALDAKKKHDKG